MNSTDIIVDNPVIFNSKEDIKRALFYKSKKICLASIENFDDYIDDIIENDVHDLLFLVSEDVLNKKTKGISPIMSSILFNSKNCFNELMRTTEDKNLLKLAKLCSLFERDYMLKYIVRHHLSDNEITDLIRFSIEKNLVNSLKMIDYNFTKKDIEYAVDAYNKNNRIRDVMYHILETSNSIDVDIFNMLKNSDDLKILSLLTTRFNHLVNDKLLNSIKNTKMSEFLKVFSNDLEKSLKNTNITCDFEKHRDELILNLLIENNEFIIKDGIDNNVFSLEDIKNVVLKSDLSKYANRFNITHYDCPRFDSANCLEKNFKNDNTDKLLKLIAKNNSFRCLRVLYEKRVDIKNILFMSLKYSSYDFFIRVLEYGLRSNENCLKLLLEDNCFEAAKKLNLFKNLIKDADLLTVCKNRLIDDSERSVMVSKIIDVTGNKKIRDENKRTYAHLLCMLGSEYFTDSIDFYSKEDIFGKIPIEYLRESIKSTKDTDKLKKLVKLYDKLNLHIVIRKKFDE